MSIRVVCLSGLIAAFAATSALAAEYGDQRPPAAAAQYQPLAHANHLPFQLKMMWRREERAHLHAMPRVQRRGWIRAEWSRMSDQQKQAKLAELKSKWDALPANVREMLLRKQQEKREARRMNMRNSRGMQRKVEQPAAGTQQ
jgi:hypothetical protein